MFKKINHIAFIMDGNGRYALERNKNRTFGHAEGAKRIPEIILACKEHQIPYISFFAFSTENWNRSKTEVTFLMKLLKQYMNKKHISWFQENKINLEIIGFINQLDTNLKKSIYNFVNKVNQKKFNTKVCIFFNYGSRAEIIETCKKIVEKNLTINEENFNNNLMTNNLPDVDLLIRTSGEKRISNFLLWQIAYSEIIFETAKWPEYNKEILYNNIQEYYSRDRRFGKVDENN